jgi:hypothetical protein
VLRIAAAALAALTLTATAAASVDAGTSLRISFLPKQAFKGQPASLSIVVRPTGVRCTPVIRYADGSSQRLASVITRAGRASWRWTIPNGVRIGNASVNVTCSRAGRTSRSFAVAGPATAPAEVKVRKSGFSQRVRAANRDVSYGVVLHNPSPENDALDVTVLVNFIDTTNRVVNTDSQRIEAADPAGNVIGGTRGSSGVGQLPGVRSYFQASSGASSIPIDQAASASVSALGRYEATS